MFVVCQVHRSKVQIWSPVGLLHLREKLLRASQDVLRRSSGHLLEDVMTTSSKKIFATSISDRSKTFLRRLCDVFVPAGIMLFSLTYFRTTGYFDLFKVCIHFPYFLIQLWLGLVQSSNNCRILRGSAYQREVLIVNSATAAYIRGSAYWRKYCN